MTKSCVCLCVCVCSRDIDVFDKQGGAQPIRVQPTEAKTQPLSGHINNHFEKYNTAPYCKLLEHILMTNEISRGSYIQATECDCERTR